MGSAGSYLWTQESGYTSVEALAQQAGVKIPPGWQLNLVLGMSDDAKTIVGTAFGPAPFTSPFVLDLRPSAPACPAVFNGDQEVGAQYLAVLLGDWGTVGSSADLNGDGEVGAQDLAALRSAWGVCS